MTSVPRAAPADTGGVLKHETPPGPAGLLKIVTVVSRTDSLGATPPARPVTVMMVVMVVMRARREHWID
jgi:hypothetical protein